MLTMKVTEKSIILPVEFGLFLKLNSNFTKGYNNILLDSSQPRISIDGNGYPMTEIEENIFSFLPYLLDENNKQVFDNFLLTYATLDAETKQNFVKHLKNNDFKNTLLLHLNNTQAMEHLLNDFNLEFSLIYLNLCIAKHQKSKNERMIRLLSTYIDTKFTPEELDELFFRQDEIKLGKSLPNLDELGLEWTFIKENGEITLIGYKGSFDKIQIPKIISDGTKITKIENHILSPDKDEFLFVNADIENVSTTSSKDTCYINLYKDFFTKFPRDLSSKEYKSCFVQVHGCIDSPLEFDEILSLFDTKL